MCVYVCIILTKILEINNFKKFINYKKIMHIYVYVHSLNQTHKILLYFLYRLYYVIIMCMCVCIKIRTLLFSLIV